MVKNLLVTFTIIITSFYFFPFEFTFLPGVNTKMILAGISLLVLAIQLAKKQQSAIDGDLFKLSIIAIILSLITFVAVVFNNTHDYTYVSYIISMWVWMGGAYLTTKLIKAVHGFLSVELVCNYLIAVCTFQCLIAYSMDLFPPVKSFVDSFLGGTGFMGKTETRMYGIGAALDVAGSRFAAILVIISYLSVRLSEGRKQKAVWLYLLAFVIITVIGNVMSRTTIVGVGLSLLYFVYSLYFSNDREKSRGLRTKILLSLLCAIPVVTFLYQTNPGFHENMRFAFEGFFSLVEKGKWEVSSNKILENMYVFPDNLKTWLIGDGFMENPYSNEPYYVGPNFGGYYMATDVGYLRFIFYFGIFGLLTFMYFIFQCAKVCMDRFRGYRLLFVVILLINYVVWLKVASDIFLVFALFLCISSEENEEYERANILMQE